MKNKLIRALAILLTLALSLSLAGCGETADVYSQWIDLVEADSSSDNSEEAEAETSSEDTVAQVSSVTSESSKPTKSTKVSEINITNGKTSNYKIVVSLSNDGYDEGRLMQKVIKKTTGVAIPMITDNESNKDKPEIIIGKTDRDLSKQVEKTLGNNEYIIKAFDNGSIVILGDNVTALGLAVDKFLKNYFGYDENASTVGKEKSISVSLNIHQKALEDYKLVWNDEFSTNKLDETKWGFEPYMKAQTHLFLYQDERVLKIKDGCLNLYADNIKDSLGNPTDNYFTNTSLTTSGNMIFKYGYLEMRAKVPFGKPAHPSFWLQSSSIAAEAPMCMAETDIFEHFATKVPYLQYGIHKWYRDGTGEHYLCKNIERYTFTSEALAEQWHTYGFWWTPKKMYTLVDGVIYGCKDITDETGDFGDRGDGMQAFRDYAYIIFNNWLVTENTSSEIKEESEYAVPSDFANGPITFTIDYVRLYQIPGQGGIINVKDY